MWTFCLLITFLIKHEYFFSVIFLSTNDYHNEKKSVNSLVSYSLVSLRQTTWLPNPQPSQLKLL